MCYIEMLGMKVSLDGSEVMGLGQNNSPCPPLPPFPPSARPFGSK